MSLLRFNESLLGKFDNISSFRSSVAVIAESEDFQHIVRRSRIEDEYFDEIQAQPSIQPTWFLVKFFATFLIT